jgi:hypothetical protein
VLFGSGYAAGLVTPPWLVAPPSPFWTVIYLGTAPLLALPAALVWGGRRLGYWGLATIAMAAMALGPSLHLHYPLADPLPPSPDMPPPWAPPGLYAVAAWLLPVLRFSRAPFRWVVAAEIALAVIMAIGIAGLRARLTSPVRRCALTAAILGVIVAGAALDVRGLRAHLASAAIPPAYALLRDDPAPAAVLELPAGSTAGGFAAFSSYYMYYQTAHRKFLLDGTVSRLPPGSRGARARSADRALPYVRTSSCTATCSRGPALRAWSDGHLRALAGVRADRGRPGWCVSTGSTPSARTRCPSSG